MTQETKAVLHAAASDLEKINPNALQAFAKEFFPWLLNFAYNLLIAAFLLFIGAKLLKYVKKWTNKSLHKLGMDATLSRFTSSCIAAVLYCMLLFVAAGRVGVSSASIFALLGSAGIAVSLALQTSLSNFAGGAMLLALKPFQIGDYIVSASGEGTVKTIGIIYTSLLTPDNKEVMIPNGTLFNSTLTNVTAQKRRRLILDVNISYDSDLLRAKEILQKLITEHSGIQQQYGTDVFVDELGTRSVLLKARGWTSADNYWPTRWDLTEQIKLSFDAAGIEIPHNQLEVQLVDASAQKNRAD